MKHDELELCPACGDKGGVSFTILEFYKFRTRHCCCFLCNFRTPDCSTVEEAIKLWNDQPRIEAYKQEIFYLEESVERLQKRLKQ